MSDLIFKTLVDVEHDLGVGKAEIEWGLEAEVREWGVKSLIIYVPDQRITIATKTEDAEGEEHDSSFGGDLVNVSVEKPDSFGIVVPQTLRYWRGKWTLEFA